MHDSNVFVWQKIGIEHYYPKEILKRTYSHGDAESLNVDLNSNTVAIKDIRKLKNEFAEIVCSHMTKDDVVDDKIQRVLSHFDKETT